MSEFDEAGGVLVLGGIDESLYEGSIEWLDVKRLDFYGFDVSSLVIGDTLIRKR
jgi:hypothetical protein